MKSKMKKIISVCMSLLAAATVCLASGCKDKEESAGLDYIRESAAGIHQMDHKMTSKSFIVGGATDYVIVYPEERTDYLDMAKNELTYFFKEATGINIKSKKDTGLTHAAGNKYISLGDTTLLASSGISFDRAALERDGYQIITKDDTIFIINGTTESGCINGVYTLLELAFDYEYFWLDQWQINRNVSNLNLIDFNVRDVPDIPYRRSAAGILASTEGNEDYNLAMATYRYRYDIAIGKAGSSYVITQHGGRAEAPTAATRSMHNSLFVVPPDEYFAEHPDWYSPGKAQICYTAHGDEAERDALAEVVAQKMQYSLKKYLPSEYPYSHLNFSIEDTMACCSCTACAENKEKYGTDAASVVQFMNIVGRKVDEWMMEQEGQPWYRDDLKISFYAYLFAEDAPVKYDEEQGKYVPIDESVALYKNVAPFYCALKSFDFSKSPKDELNRKGVENLYAWSDLCNGIDKMYLWMYSTNFHDYTAQYDSFNFYSDDWFELLRGTNVYHYHTQSQSGSANSGTAWHNLKIYLDSKLSWDSSLDEGELLKKWFKAMYKDAADVMMDAFLEMRAYNEIVFTDYELHIKRSNYHTMQKKEYFSMRTLDMQMAKFEEAVAAIEKYNAPATQETYLFLKRNIMAEWINPAYFKLSIWSAEMGEIARADLVAKLLEAVELTGVNKTMEKATALSLKESILSFA